MKKHTPNIQLGILHNAGDFSELSQSIGVKGGGELIVKPSRPENYDRHFNGNNRRAADLTTLVGDTGERVMRLLLPGSKHLPKSSGFDLIAPSRFQKKEKVLVEVKTAQTRNRGVIRIDQMERYMSAEAREKLYLAQIFYYTKNGIPPNQIPRDEFVSQFLPIAAYIFPISFIIHLINTIQPTGRQEATRFYGLTYYRARNLLELAKENQDTFTAQIIQTTKLRCNREMVLHVVDHRDTPHILGL